MIEETGKAVSEVSRLRKSSTLADRVAADSTTGGQGATHRHEDGEATSL